MNSTWNSLEVAKLFVSFLTPLVVLLVGVWVRKLLEKLESAQWVNQTVIEWKMRAYEEMAPALNDVFCYMLYVGSWKELTPPKILETKRFLDKKIAVLGPLFSDGPHVALREFMDLCFKTWRRAQLGRGVPYGF